MVKAGLSLRGIVWAFTHCYASNWHPLTWISHMVDCQLFGLSAGGPHAENVLLHATNSIILFLLLYRLTGAQWRSAVVAGLFALHPLHVESVAWISERKDVLSTFFGLLSLLAYVNGVRGHWKNGKRWSLIFFGVGLLAKPMLVTLPFVMLLLDFWPLQRVENTGLRTFLTREFRKLAFEKWPWLALTLGSCLMTFYAQKTGGAVMKVTTFPFFWRLVNALEAYFWYVQKLFWPVKLAAFYPLAHERVIASFIGEALCIILISAGVLVTIRRWPFLLIGWLWFLGTLVPVIGLVQVGGQSMADRYDYIPSIGIFVAVVWGCGELLNRSKVNAVTGFAVAGVLLTLCAVATVSQARYWRNGIALFGHAAVVTLNNATAYDYLGVSLYSVGRNAEAKRALQIALQIDPTAFSLHKDIGLVLAKEGKPDEALLQYREELRLYPDNPETQNFLGSELAARGKKEEALTHHSEAVRLKPSNAEYQNNLGAALAALGKKVEALAHYAEAVRLEPDNAQYQNNYGTALAREGQSQDAIEHYLAAVHLNPKYAEAYSNLGAAYFAQHRLEEAVECFRNAIGVDPKNGDAHNNLGNALLSSGRLEEATAEYSRALQLSPTNGTIHLNMGLALAKLGRGDDATTQFAEAVRMAPTSIKARYEYGRQLFFGQKFQAAFEQLTETLRLQPENAQTEFYLGLVCEELGQEETGLQHLREAVRLRPDWPDALNAEAWAMATSENERLRNGTEAVRLATKAAELTSYLQPAILKTLAASYAEAGQFQQAMVTAKDAVEKAQRSNQTNLVKDIEQALASYQTNQPYRQKGDRN